MLEWKSFHLSEYCCSPLDEDEEAAMASVPSGPTAEGTRGAIVLTLAPHGDTFTSPSRRVSPRAPLSILLPYFPSPSPSSSSSSSSSRLSSLTLLRQPNASSNLTITRIPTQGETSGHCAFFLKDVFDTSSSEISLVVS